MGRFELLGVRAELQQPVSVAQQGITGGHRSKHQMQADDGDLGGCCDFSLPSVLIGLNIGPRPVSMRAAQRGMDGLLDANDCAPGRGR